MSCLTAEAGEPSNGQLPGREKQEEPMIKLPTFHAIALANRMRETNRTARDRGASDEASRPHRDIGPIGTAARLVVGLLLGGLIVYGQLSSSAHLTLITWVLALIGFPTLAPAPPVSRIRPPPAPCSP